MKDESYLDRKYFIDNKVYNCPFCNRNNVSYHVPAVKLFHWSGEKFCWAVFVACSSCKRVSMHLTYDVFELFKTTEGARLRKDTSGYIIKDGIDIDSYIFYSVPTSFFTLDSRIHRVIRELVSEAEGCLKMNYLTGASACMRKAIYELLVKEEAKGDDYGSKIKFLKDKYRNSDPDFFDILGHIQDMTSDKIHEQSWPKWDSDNLKLIIETLKSVLHDIYVLPAVQKERSKEIRQMKAKVQKEKTGKRVERPAGETDS